MKFVDLARKAESTADLDAALAHYQGDLFPDDRYADWAEPLREELVHLYHQTLLRRAQEHLRTGDARAVLSDCRLLLSRDPCQEDATLLAMQASMALADRPAALRFYHRLEQALEREFQLAPRSDLMHFAATLRQRTHSSAKDS
jgi:DNA-binding SARP family transcriptional activator